MKRVILFTLIIFFNSCSPEEQEKIDALGINPPVWIQGTWIVKDDTLGKRGLKFTNKSFFTIDENGNETNVMLSYLILQGLGEDVTVEEFIDQDIYSIKVSTVNRDTLYRFTKISAQEISWNDRPPIGEAEIYVKSN